MIMHRSSSLELFCKNGALRNVEKFTRKPLRLGLVFNKFSSLKPATVSKEKFWHGCFTKMIAKFLKIAFKKNTSDITFKELFSLTFNKS